MYFIIKETFSDQKIETFFEQSDTKLDNDIQQQCFFKLIISLFYFKQLSKLSLFAI